MHLYILPQPQASLHQRTDKKPKASLHQRTHYHLSFSLLPSLSMGAPQYLSSLSCELRIIQAKNIEFKSSGSFFVRYYLSAGNNKRVQLNSQEISLKSSNLIWNEFLSLECLGSEDSINNLKKQSVVFELRWRNKLPVFGKIGKSKLLGRAEIPWKTVFDSPNMEMENWVMLISKNSNVFEDVKPPSLQIAMKVRVPAMVEMEKKRRNGKSKKWDECGCKDGGGCKCEDYEIFALVAAFEAL